MKGQSALVRKIVILILVLVLALAVVPMITSGAEGAQAAAQSCPEEYSGVRDLTKGLLGCPG